MGIENVLGLIGGLALFLFGIDSMGKGLEAACGNRMKSILQKLTSNRFVGVCLGAGVTAIIQSSSATTVMVVGFVNAGMMTLSQAIWVIMGANIGTTITSVFIALDVGLIAPIFAVIGVVMLLFVKNEKVNDIGKILAGFGILFIGMDMMSGAMTPLRDNATFIDLMTKFSNPIIGILVGAVFTAIIQSSSASVGILQALAMSGVIGLESSVFVLFGMNIGTCITALLASASANRSAKRTTLFHIMFNVTGTIVFTIICLVTPLVEFMEGLTSEPAMQIANMHMLFNITTTILLLPIGQYYAKLIERIMPDRPVNDEQLFEYLSNDMTLKLGSATTHYENLKREMTRMYNLSMENVLLSFEDLQQGSCISRSKIVKTESLVDKLNEGIIKHITTNLPKDHNQKMSETYGCYVTITNNIERISDHCMNISDELKTLTEKELVFGASELEEIGEMKELCEKLSSLTLDKEEFEKVKALENETDEMTRKFKESVLLRLQNGEISAECSIIYSTILINFERIGDHILNIAEQIQKVEG